MVTLDYEPVTDEEQAESCLPDKPAGVRRRHQPGSGVRGPERSRPTPNEPEDDLVDPCRDHLYQQFQPLVRSLVRRYGKTAELRQDLHGEIYYRFCRLVAEYEPERGIPIRPYIVRMLSQSVFNYVRDYWRKESRYTALDTGEEGALADRQVGETGADWDLSLIADEIKEALPGAIARLPHRQKMVVVWRYYDGRSFEEIAAHLNIKPATARSLLRHGLAALRQALT